MIRQFSPALERLIQAKMASGRYASEEALLASALASLDEIEEDLTAIEAGLESVDRGDAGVSAEEAFSKLRAKYQIRD